MSSGVYNVTLNSFKSRTKVEGKKYFQSSKLSTSSFIVSNHHVQIETTLSTKLYGSFCQSGETPTRASPKRSSLPFLLQCHFKVVMEMLIVLYSQVSRCLAANLMTPLMLFMDSSNNLGWKEPQEIIQFHLLLMVQLKLSQSDQLFCQLTIELRQYQTLGTFLQ